MPETKEKYRAPALEKGLDILELLSSHSDGLAQGDIARALDRSQSEIYRMLSTLVRRGYVIRSSESELYLLSLKLFVISQKFPPIERLVEVATPKMRAVTRQAWQSCHLGTENNGDIVVIASVQTPGNWGLALRAGSVIGLGNTGTGRVLAAFRSDDDIGSLLDAHTLAQGEPDIDRSEFMDHVARIRELGYEQMPSATAVGVTNMAYPVLNHEGRAIAVVNCPYLQRIDQFDVPSIEEVHILYRGLALELSDYYSGKMAADEG